MKTAHWLVAAAATATLTLTGATYPSPTASTVEDDDRTQVEGEFAASSGQAAFSDVVGSLLEAYPAQIIDFSWESSAGTLVVTPEGAPDVERYLAHHALDLNVEVSAPGAVAYIERQALEMSVLRQFDGAGVDSLAARYNADTHSVDVTVWTDNRSADERLVALALAWTEEHLATGLKVSVDYEPADDQPQETATQGGEVYGGCTGNFMGTRGSAYGIITAAHCTTKPTYYDGDRTGSTYVASNNRDVRFTALSGDTPENRFRVNSTTLRTISSTGIVSTGTTLFKYGKNTGYGSSTVESYEGCVGFTSGNTWCNLYYTETDVTSGGDSGGPWFAGYRGYGLTTGSDSGGSYITPIAYVASISGGVTVMTN